MDLMSRHIALASMYEGQVPPPYTACDYLQTVGYDTRFDTGVPGNDASLEIDCTAMVITYSAWSSFVGNYVNETTKAWRVMVGSTKSSIYFTSNERRAGSSSAIQAVGWDTQKANIHLSTGHMKVTVDGVVTEKTTESTSDTANTTNLCIGAPNMSQSGGTRAFRLFGPFRIWSGGKLIRDYRPCVRNSDSVAGYYDVVNRTFNPSTGSKQFVSGNE